MGKPEKIYVKNLSNHFKINIDYPLLYDSREWRIMQHLQNIPGGIPMAPNLINTLSQLSEQGVILSLVSNNPISRALTAMRFADNGQGDLLAGLFGSRFFEAGEVQKPKPDIYQRAMLQVGAKPEYSFAVEDSITGSSSSVRAGITTFGFTGYADNAVEMGKKLLDNGCVAVFNSWEEFPAHLFS